MKVVVVDAFDRGNRGDAALLSVAVQQVQEAFPGAQVLVAAFEDPAEWPEFEDVRNIGSVRRYVGEETAGRAARIARKVAALGAGAVAALPGGGRLASGLAALLPQEMRNEIRAVMSADLVLSVGGGHLNARPDLPSDLNIAFLLLPLWLAQRAGVPTVLGPQSFGPFPRRRQRWMVKRVVGRAVTAVAREDISVARLAEAGVTEPTVRRGVDSAFAFHSRSRRPWRAELGVPGDARLVLVTARRHLPGPQQETYEAAMAAAVRRVLDDGGHVVLVPQVTCAFQGDDDRPVNARIAAHVGPHPALHILDDAGIDHHDVHALYGTADFILGTRFHSVIFGLTSGVPCAAVEYDHKTRGIMADLGLEEWVVRMSEAQGTVVADLLDRLLLSGDDYRKRLRAVLPAYTAQAGDFVGVLRAAVHR
ncbi:colanic acid biosynthesis pyruvyl transferase WcaK [Streptomyces sp. Y2F8-2]|uniref:polysaccharide pyruvyl transferase family protein n=1 Tax=Streptomyces sp. Y2F8-2 TaxID=2759675 RepID=UPI00190862ED|nr:polysaccharide pyruvyl transferase family protein [Streptomyces sp. Y2F8-2]GHK02645.1 colanic acid biosynthesis pyruvyl transferase WcaK [Streptomyces sp. Y2F8-2]